MLGLVGNRASGVGRERRGRATSERGWLQARAFALGGGVSVLSVLRPFQLQSEGEPNDYKITGPQYRTCVIGTPGRSGARLTLSLFRCLTRPPDPLYIYNSDRSFVNSECSTPSLLRY